MPEPGQQDARGHGRVEPGPVQPVVIGREMAGPVSLPVRITSSTLAAVGVPAQAHGRLGRCRPHGHLGRCRRQPRPGKAPGQARLPPRVRAAVVRWLGADRAGEDSPQAGAETAWEFVVDAGGKVLSPPIVDGE